MQTLNGRFDGKVVILDGPVDLLPNTRVTVIAMAAGKSEDELVNEFAQASEPTFKQLWDNPLDADYDRAFRSAIGAAGL